MKMGMDESSAGKIGMGQHTGMEFRAVNAGTNKRGGVETAYGKGTILKQGAVEICMVRQTVEFYLVKTGLTEEVRRKPRLSRRVKHLLIDDFQQMAIRTLEGFE